MIPQWQDEFTDEVIGQQTLAVKHTEHNTGAILLHDVTWLVAAETTAARRKREKLGYYSVLKSGFL